MGEMIDNAINSAFKVLDTNGWTREGDEAWCEPGDMQTQGFNVRDIVRSVIAELRQLTEDVEDIGEEVAKDLAMRHRYSAQMIWEAVIDGILNENMDKEPS